MRGRAALPFIEGRVRVPFFGGEGVSLPLATDVGGWEHDRNKNYTVSLVFEWRGKGWCFWGGEDVDGRREGVERKVKIICQTRPSYPDHTAGR